MKIQSLTAVLLGLLLSLPLQAAVSDAEFAQMQAQLAALAQRLNSLEAENSQLKASSAQTIKDVAVTREQVARVGSGKKAASWTNNIKWKGDFRYRYENIDEENKDDRDRNRIRARAALIAKLPDDVEVGLGLASGGDDPVSTNQTLGGGASTKDIRLDLAYANWQAMEGLNLLGGKFKNVWYRPQKSGLIFDADFNPEGVGLVYKKDWFFANLAGTWLESDTKGENDSYSWGAQAGYKGQLAGAKVTFGGAYYNFDTEGKSPFHGDVDDFFGNSFSCSDPNDLSTCVYANDYNIIQGFADVSMTVADMPVKVFVDYVVNDDADDNDTGYIAGIQLGKASGAGSWQLAYSYEDLEADAVLGLLTDSDFAGGGTDAKGHIIKGAYAINKKWKLGMTYFINEIDENAGNKHDYDRIQIDTQFKY
ncbi:MAG: putative porin [Halieaceae bacterium]